MNKHLVSVTTAIAIAAAGGFAYAQSDAQSANNNGVPGVELNVGSNAKNDGGLPGVEMNAGAGGDQKNIDTSTLGAGPADTSSGDLTQPQVDRN